MHWIRLLVLFTVASGPLSARAADPTAWSLDPVHTRVLVGVGHAGFSQALGTVSGSTGALLFEPGDWTSARLDVRVPLQALDFGDAAWNAAVLGPRLLDASAHPEARFVSDNVIASGERQARVCGTLELRGQVRPQCLEVTMNAVDRHPMPPFRRTAGFSATATLSRSDFGIDAWSTMIGDTVTLRIEAEALRDRSAAETFRTSSDPTPPPAGATTDAGVTPAAPGSNDIEAAAREAAESESESEKEPTP